MRTAHVLLAMSLCAGCAHTEVHPEQAAETREPRPSRIAVYDFGVSAEDIAPQERIAAQLSSTPPSERDIKIGHDVAEALAQRLASDLRDKGFVVERKRAGEPVERGELAIRGEFMRVDEGDQAKRLVIGFGAGESKIETQVHVFYGGHGKVLEFGTHADSGKMPGAAATLGAGLAYEGAVTTTMLATNAASGTYKEYHSAIERMSARTADEAAHYLTKYFDKQQWLPADKDKTAKRDE